MLSLYEIETKIQKVENILLYLEIETNQLEYKFNTKQLRDNNKKISINSTTFLYMVKNIIHLHKMKSLDYEKILFNKKYINCLEKLHMKLISDLQN